MDNANPSNVPPTGPARGTSSSVQQYHETTHRVLLHESRQVSRLYHILHVRHCHERPHVSKVWVHRRGPFRLGRQLPRHPRDPRSKRRFQRGHETRLRLHLRPQSTVPSIPRSIQRGCGNNTDNRDAGPVSIPLEHPPPKLHSVSSNAGGKHPAHTRALEMVQHVHPHLEDIQRRTRSHVACGFDRTHGRPLRCHLPRSIPNQEKTSLL